MSTVEFSFGQIEAVCAALNRIASDKRVAFAGRLKQLQKQGLMDESRRPGRGKAGTYSFSDLMRFVVAVELIQAGLMPQMAARLVNGSWSALQYTIFSATYTDVELEEWKEMPFGPTTVDWYWMLTPEALREMTDEGFGKYDHMEAIMPVPVDEVAERLISDREIGVFGEGWRKIVLHGTRVARAAIFLVEHQFRYGSREDMRAEIQDEFDRLRRLLDDSPIDGVEEAARKELEVSAEAAAHNMQDETLRARYYPSDAVLERQATRMVKKLHAYQLAYILNEEFGGEETADIRAMNRLIAHGLIVPDIKADTLKLTLSPLGRVVQQLAADVDIPANAIKEYRKSERARIDDAVQRKITALLARDPDNPEDDEALDRWARHGGPAPLSEARKKEVSRKFVRGVLDEIGDDPEMRQEFVDTVGRIAARNGDDQKA